MIKNRCINDIFTYCSSPSKMTHENKYDSRGAFAYEVAISCPHNPRECASRVLLSEEMKQGLKKPKKRRATIKI